MHAHTIKHTLIDKHTHTHSNQSTTVNTNDYQYYTVFYTASNFSYYAFTPTLTQHDNSKAQPRVSNAVINMSGSNR